jgi:hypothetical protein
MFFFTTFTTNAQPVEYDSLTAKRVVKSLSLEEFKSVIKTLSDMGDRIVGSQANTQAQQWLQKMMEDAGYKTTIQSSYKNVFCTKVGSISPDSGYIIGSHYDGRSGGGAADDNGSGTALVIEAARAFASSKIKTHYSIRFVVFNNEETGLNGSSAYVSERSSLQGKENPVGSKLYPEPLWRGVIVHDMVLFDHGVPPQQEQITGADIDVEYKAGSTAAQKSLVLAEALVAGCKKFSSDYPAQVGNNMAMTDSDPFKNLVASVSVRENQRMSEIGSNSNPHYHTSTDLYNVYSEKDFLLGLNTVQMTVGTMCQLAGVFDSANTSLVVPKFEKGRFALVASDYTEFKIFNLKGKEILTCKPSGFPQTFFTGNSKKEKLSGQLYIVQLLSPNPRLNRFIRIVP